MQHYNKIFPTMLWIPALLVQYPTVIADHGSLGFGISTAAPVVTQTAISLPNGMWAGGILTNFTSFDSASNVKLLDNYPCLEKLFTL